MKLGFCVTRLASARLFKVCGVGKTEIRGMQSKPDGSVWGRRSSSTDNGHRQQVLWHASQATYEDEFPPLSASFMSKSNMKGKRRTRVDLSNSSEQTPKQDTKRHSPLRKLPVLPQTHVDRRGEEKQSSMPVISVLENKPFDICPPETRQSIHLQSFAVQKVEPDSVKEKNDKAEDNPINDSVEEGGLVLRPGMVLFKRYICLEEQINIVNKCRELGCGPGGFYQPGYNDGAKLRLYMMCLGLDWDPQTKSYREIRDHDNTAPPTIPHEFTSLVTQALDDSHTLIQRHLPTANPEEILPTISPDVCIVNFYTTAGRLGLHQDRDESTESLEKRLPVVSISIGDAAEFLYGDARDVKRATCVKLESGDVLIFGGESRHIFHGVKTIIPDSAPPDLREITGLRPGRLNLTFRKY